MDAGQAVLPPARQTLQLLAQIPGVISEAQGLLRGFTQNVGDSSKNLPKIYGAI